jgi:hypothetical protein
MSSEASSSGNRWTYTSSVVRHLVVARGPLGAPLPWPVAPAYPGVTPPTGAIWARTGPVLRPRCNRPKTGIELRVHRLNAQVVRMPSR